MVKRLIILLLFISNITIAQNSIKKLFKFSTFYAAASGGTSISDLETFSVTNGLETSTVKTPYDYNLSLGIRKIARFGYENKAQTFYDGTENSWSDGANIGKVSGLEFLFEVDYKRQQGKLSFNAGLAQRLSEPYGYNPLQEWVLDNGDIHYTYLALQEGYTVDVYSNEYFDPNGTLVATSPEVWEEVVIPTVLADYTEKKRNELDLIIQHSIVLGFDYYKYSKSFWTHTWANIMPYHYDSGGDFSYHKYNDGQWLDYSGGLIFGYKLNKQLGTFIEGKYNKYWNRTWYDFKLGVNYVIF